MKIKLEYSGWFLFCPIYIGDIQSTAPVVHPKWDNHLLFWLAQKAAIAWVFFQKEKYWPIVITKQLKEAKYIESN